LKTSESLLAQLNERGLLLQQDKTLPNVVSTLAGESVRGSWWTHPRAHTIYNCLIDLAGRPDVLVTKLVSGKVTFVHRRLWPAVLAVATSHEPWQFERLTEYARSLYESVERQGRLLSSGQDAKTLEQRLLVHGEQVHTDSGKHQLWLETWSLWAGRAGCKGTLDPSEGKLQLESAVRALGGTEAMLPWHNKPTSLRSEGRRRKTKDE